MGGSEATYQFQPVDAIIFDILHDVPMLHPLRHSNELAFFHVSLNTSQVQDVRMGYCLPEDGFFAKLLENDGRNRVLGDWEDTIDAHLSYLLEVVLRCNPHGLHRDELPPVPSTPDIREATGGEYLVLDFDLFRYHHRIW